MTPIVRQFRDFFVSLKLTVVLLALSIVLIFWATLAQVHLGIWGVQQKFFHSFIVITVIGQDISLGEFLGLAGALGAVTGLIRWLFSSSPEVRTLLNRYVFPCYGLLVFGSAGIYAINRHPLPVPVFPGGYFLGGLLLVNLVAAHTYRFKLEARKTGILLTHTGLILLLVGELLSSLLQVETQMRIEEGATTHYSESNRLTELVLVDTTDPKFDEVVAIPEAVLGDGGVIQHPKLPFQLKIRDYYPNATVQMRDQVPNAAPAIATTGLGPRVVVTPLPLTHKEGERNAPAAHIELVGPESSLGVWMVSLLVGMPQKIDYQGRAWVIGLRAKRTYHPFSLMLHDFTHDVYPGTDIPKNFSSRIQLKTDGGHDDREVLIYMNNPLRHAGLTFYQASFERGDKVTILQVVRNPGWLLPYFACVMMGLGLLIQFSIHLVGFVRKRAA